jgi:hypothetical protein
MGTLMFECPASGTTVTTGIEMDADTFKSLAYDTPLKCPHCDTPHPIGLVRRWLSGNAPKPPARSPIRSPIRLVG